MSTTKAKPAAKPATPTGSKSAPGADKNAGAKAPAANPFLGVIPNLGQSAASMFATGANDEYDTDVDLDDIEIAPQQRQKFEDTENTLDELGESLKKKQLMSILLVLNPAGSQFKYRLVAGERRVRAARLKQLKTLRARVSKMTPEEIEDAQFAENVQRLNLTQIEEAAKVQKDFDTLGSVEAVLAKHNKSRAWLSKLLSLLNLPDQAKRLVTESISADVEVINAVKQVEKIDPEKAKELVDELKSNRGQVNQRERTQAVKDQVKPKTAGKDKRAGATEGTKASEKDRSQEVPSGGKIFAPAKISALAVLDKAYVAIYESRTNASTVVDGWADDERAEVAEWLRDYYDAGRGSKDGSETAVSVLRGFRGGSMGTDGALAFGLVAFLHGAKPGTSFDLLGIVASVKE